MKNNGITLEFFEAFRKTNYDGAGQPKSADWIIEQILQETNPVRKRSLIDTLGSRLDRGNEAYFRLRELGLIVYKTDNRKEN